MSESSAGSRVCAWKTGRSERAVERHPSGTGSPVDLAVERGSAAFAVLLEAQVDRAEGPAIVRHAVDDEPAGERVAPASLAGPAEPAVRGIVEGIALEVSIVAGLQLNGAGHALEVAAPGLVADDDRQAVADSGDGDRGKGWRIGEGLFLADVVALLALQIDVVAHSGRGAGSRLPEARRRAGRRAA